MIVLSLACSGCNKGWTAEHEEPCSTCHKPSRITGRYAAIDVRS